MDTPINSFPKAILFDWDDTLVATRSVIAAALNATRAYYGLETWTEEETRTKSSRAARVSFPEWFGDKSDEALAMFYDLFAKTHCEKLKEKPGATSLLRAIQKMKIPLLLLSNKKGMYLREEINHLGWADIFTNVVGAGDAVKDKPAMEAVDLTLKDTGFTRGDPGIWFVGDAHTDVTCAQEAGMTPVLMHHLEIAQQFNVKIFFSDCHTMETALYNQLNSMGHRRWPNSKSGYQV